MKYNWWLWQSELSDEVIDGIIERCETYPETTGAIGGDHVGSITEFDDSYRRSIIRWPDEFKIEKLVWNYVHSANKASFGFDITNNCDIQYTTYNGSDNGCYNWHADSSFKEEGYYTRKLTMVAQLTDPSEYEGGKFEFKIDGKIISPEGFGEKGSVIVFPSFLEHRVTEVTKGTRNSLVSWVQGPHFR